MQLLSSGLDDSKVSNPYSQQPPLKYTTIPYSYSHVSGIFYYITVLAHISNVCLYIKRLSDILPTKYDLVLTSSVTLNVFWMIQYIKVFFLEQICFWDEHGGSIEFMTCLATRYRYRHLYFLFSIILYRYNSIGRWHYKNIMIQYFNIPRSLLTTTALPKPSEM